PVRLLLCRVQFRQALALFCELGQAHVLLSFPTRRSSDLHKNGANDRRHHLRRNLRNPGKDIAHEMHPAALPRTALERDLDRANKDRKSTRLNSSHVKISYAVFCWKKKKLVDPAWSISTL